MNADRAVRGMAPCGGAVMGCGNGDGVGTEWGRTPLTRSTESMRPDALHPSSLSHRERRGEVFTLLSAFIRADPRFHTLSRSPPSHDAPRHTKAPPGSSPAGLRVTPLFPCRRPSAA